MECQSLPEMFFTRATQFGDRPRYRHCVGTEWREVSWNAMAERVRSLAAALIEQGVAPGDRVGLLSSTRPEWMEADLAILACGGVTVPIYPSVLAPECGYILDNADARVVIVESPKQREKVVSVRDQGFDFDGTSRRVAVRLCITIDGDPGDGLGWDACLARGRALRPQADAEIDRRMAALTRETLATIVYTSGTTGPPKGVPQTHGNHLATVGSAMGLQAVQEGEVDFFFLPLAHSFARMLEYLGIAAGTVTAFARSIDTLVEDLAIAKPHLVPAVPRVFEKVYARIHAARESGSFVTQAVFDWAIGVGRERSGYEQRGEAVPWWVQLQDAVAHRLVFARIHETLGGNVKYMLSGGAPLAREIAEFFHAAGILILEGYGLTETTPALTVNRPASFRLGTVGQPLDCCEIRIAEDGEILARGANVASGYYRRPEATAESWDDDGWFRTGDIGEIDTDGFLRITDRKKDLLKTSGGKYIAPQKIENLLKLQPHISQAVVIGDQRKFCVALITMDPAMMGEFARERGLPADPASLVQDPAVVSLIDGQVASVNQYLASFESIKYFRVLPQDFTVESGELTPSLKVKRKVVSERYRDVIESMYN